KRVTVSLDTLRPERMLAFAKSARHADVLEGIAAARAAGFATLKLNTVVIRGFNDDELADLIEFARSRDAEVRFIEYMDVGGATRWTMDQVVSQREILEVLGRRYGPIEPLRDDARAPAEAHGRGVMALHVALVEPHIPPNTGNIARLCAATGTPLHLVEPLGFSLDAPELKRAGLDYWDAVDLWMHRDWHAFRDVVSRDRCLYFSAHAERSFWTAPYHDRAVLVFGNESDGLPDRIREKPADRLYRIPMLDTVRSLNLATAVGIVLYEALRQQGWGDGPPPHR